MYSFEIGDLLRNANYVITQDDYQNILRNSPQIASMKYNADTNLYEITTVDGYSWQFSIRKEDKDDNAS